MSISVHPEAKLELTEAMNWYEERQSGLGNRFMAEVLSSFNLIGTNPLLGVRTRSGNRRVLVQHFPYAIFYAATADQILILAIAHTARLPNYWKSRT